MSEAVRVFPDLERASAELARHVVRRARESTAERGRFRWAISGGKTPVGLFGRLAGAEGRGLPWETTEVFFADERCVPPTDPDSNFRSAWESFLSRVPIPRRHVHRIRGELRPPSLAAARYARELAGPEGTAPPLDLVLLGIGPDGHTASLFPGSPALREARRPVVSVRRSGQPPFVARITLTPPALSAAREVCFLVAGADKADALAGIFRAGPRGDPRFPASLVRPATPPRWFLDRAAARGAASPAA